MALDSDSSDDEMMDHKKDLSEPGKQLQKQLNKQEQERPRRLVSPTPIVKKKLKETVLSGIQKKEVVAPTLFDSFFRLNIRNPKISSSTFDTYIDGYKRFRISDLKQNSVISADSWTTAGVVVSREVRKSANGKDYLIWKLHDLKDCQQAPVVLLLFGEAYKEYWKLQAGICVALMTPMFADGDKNTNLDRFKPKAFSNARHSKGFQRLHKLSSSVTQVIWVRVRASNSTDRNAVTLFNVSMSDYCVHHVMKEARKLATNRGTFNSVTSMPPPKKVNNGLYCNPRAGLSGRIGSASSSALSDNIHPTQTNAIRPSELKTTTKAEEKEVLKEIISGRAHMFGARNMKLLR
ncbi:hypothetical protein COOONC_12556 [Cooperia oncophora]